MSGERTTGALKMWWYIVAALVLGYVVPGISAHVLPWLLSPMGQDQVIAFLAAVASGMMAFTGIIFSLLFVLLQFGSTAYTPRIVAILGRNRVLYDAGGVFTGTFLYALMALRGVRSPADGGTGKLTIWVAFAWLIASLFALVRLFDSLKDLTHTHVLFLLGETGHREIERLYAPPPAPNGDGGRTSRDECFETSLDPPTQTIVYRGGPRYVVALDVRRLVDLARSTDTVIRVPLARGDAVTAGANLALVHGRRGETVPEAAVRDAIVLGRDRALEQDPKYALRLLVDIAIRALSPAVCDPTTAVQALDQIEALLTSLGNAQLDVGRVRDSSGVLRVAYEETTWEGYLDLALTEIQDYGAAAIQVERRLAALLTFVRAHVPAARAAAVDRLAEQRAAVVRKAFTDGRRERAEQADPQGLGHTL